MAHPIDSGRDFSEFSRTVESLRSVPQLMLGLNKLGLVAPGRVYFRAKPFDTDYLDKLDYEAFEDASAKLETYIFPRIEEGMRSITELMKRRDRPMPLVIYREPYQNCFEQDSLAFKIPDPYSSSGVNFYIMPTSKRNMQLAVYPLEFEDVPRRSPVSVVTIIARRGNDRITSFLIDGKRIFPTVNDFARIGGGDSVSKEGYQHYSLDDMLTYFQSKGFGSMREWWERRHSRENYI